LTDQLEENRFSKEPEVDLMEVSPAPIQMTTTAMATTPVEVGTQVVVVGIRGGQIAGISTMNATEF